MQDCSGTAVDGGNLLNLFLPAVQGVICLCLLTGWFGAKSQEITLLNSTDSLPIPYAHIQGDQYMAVSSLEGIIQIPGWLDREDTLRISCVGFKLKSVFVPAQDAIVWMEESVTELRPVVISGLSLTERLFRIVENAKLGKQDLAGLKGTYWRGVFEEGQLVERYVAALSYQSGEWVADSVQVAEGCAAYDLSSLSDAFSLFDQNHVSPPLASLKRSNEDLWKYRLVEQRLEGGELISLIQADFYSPKNFVDHTFRIWLNEDQKEILRIQFDYAWNLEFPVTLNDQRGLESDLRTYQGTILFDAGIPLYLDARYLLEVCPKFDAGECMEQEVYHEFFLQQTDRSVLPVNVSFFEYITKGLMCD